MGHDPNAAVLSAEALRRSVLELLESSAPARERLEALVYLLDGQHLLRVSAGEYDHPNTRFVRETLARAAVALGEPLIARGFPLGSTVDAAAAYARAPSDDTWEAFFEASTRSYPFGPGEGCHGLPSLGGHGAFGAGCASGAGFLASPTDELGDGDVMLRLRDALVPWLRR